MEAGFRSLDAMSGICGIHQPGADFSPLSLEPMLAALAMPGESARESTAGKSAALGVARRWDFQQLASEDGLRVAVDADLINLKELHAQIGETSSAAASANDSLAYLIARLYRREGPTFVARLHGAFAIALFDERSQRLVLAIDRLGIKSLYFSRERDRFLFASRARGILAAQPRPAEVNPAALMQFLLFSVVPAPLTSYEGIEKLRPGHRLILENGEIRHECYWDLNYDESAGSESDWSEKVREGMRAAVHRHLAGLSPESTGAYLSGGTDSSSVTAFLSEKFNPARTFSIFFSESRYDEIGYARTTAERFHTQHNELCLKPADAIEAIPKITDYYDEPFANSSAIGSYLCAKLAREKGVGTLLAGDGGDELFAGNERYAADKRFQVYHRIPGFLRRGVIEPLAKLLPDNESKLSLPRRYIRRANIPNPERIFSYGLFQSLPAQEIFTSEFLAVAPSNSWMNIISAHFHRTRASSELNRLMYMDLKLILADNDLRKVSGTAELAGVNVRYPLLDDQLAELSSRIPTRLKIKGSEKRYIFKQAMKPLLPERVLYKTKHGFGVPLALWFLQEPKLNALMQDVLRDPRTRQRGYFRPEFIDRLTELHAKDHAAYYGEVIWYLVALELWHRQHLESSREVAGVR
jgi:asparagine synthase (glutamine-hydrolysing)